MGASAPFFMDQPKGIPMTKAKKDEVSESEKGEGTRTIRIKGMERDDGWVWSTMGLHVRPEDRKFLPERTVYDRRSRRGRDGKGERMAARKFEPGVRENGEFTRTHYELPDSIALFYLKNSGKFVEEVYE